VHQGPGLVVIPARARLWRAGGDPAFARHPRGGGDPVVFFGDILRSSKFQQGTSRFAAPPREIFKSSQMKLAPDSKISLRGGH